MEATGALAHANFGRVNMQSDVQLRGQMQHGRCLKTLAAELGRGRGLAGAGGGGDLVVPVLILMMHAVRRFSFSFSFFHRKQTAIFWPLRDSC